MLTALPHWDHCTQPPEGQQGTPNPAGVKQNLPLWPLIEAGAASPEAVLLWGVIKGQQHVGAQALPWGQEVTT